VAKVLVVDPHLKGMQIEYEPALLPDDRRIDFVVDRGSDNLYVEVKTVHPRTADTEQAWQKFGDLFEKRRHLMDAWARCQWTAVPDVVMNPVKRAKAE
jgi:DNA-binding sugar fermentation-stimulating protein